MIVVLLLALPGVALGDPGGGEVLQFRLPASNGYTLQMTTEGTQTQLEVWRGNRENATTYDVSGSVEGEVIDADLGSRGRIQVRFQPSGALKTVRIGNSGCRLPRRLGTFTGTISFRGENGYASVDAVAAGGSLGPGRRACNGAGIGSPAAPSLERRPVERVWTVGDATLMSRSSSSAGTSAGTLFLAWVEGSSVHCLADRNEVVGPNLTISRQVGVTAERSVFAYTHDVRTATIAPPAPFSGEATYSARRRHLSGDLAVEFPGLGPQRLTGRSFEARLRPIH